MKKFIFEIRWEELYVTAFNVKAETKEEAKKMLEDKFTTSSKDIPFEKPEIKPNTKYGDSIRSFKEGNYMGQRVKKNAVCFILEKKKGEQYMQ